MSTEVKETGTETGTETARSRSWFHDWCMSWFWEADAERQWYYGGRYNGRLPGWQAFHVIAGFTYAAICVVPVWRFTFVEYSNPKATIKWLFEENPLFGFIWLLATTVALPLFVWWENLRFEAWFNGKNHVPIFKRKEVKERFDLNSKYMEATWKSVAGLYLVGGLLSFSSLGGESKETEVAALTKAVDALQIVVKEAQDHPDRPEARDAVQALSRVTDALNRLAAKNEPVSGKAKESSKEGRDGKDGGSAPRTPPSGAGEAASPQGAQATTPTSARTK